MATDVGMGKTAIVLALIALDKRDRFSSVKEKSEGRLGTTVVLTSVALMGQWEDEIKKHAPGLKTYRYHPSSRSRNPIDLNDRSSKVREKLLSADVIISTATFEWPSHCTDLYVFRRVVMDEAHLLSNSTTACIKYAGNIRAEFKWCVTATPFLTSLTDLKHQIEFLEFPATSPLREAWTKLTAAARYDGVGATGQLRRRFLAELQPYFIRHEKSEYVSGTMPLPPSTETSTVVVPMTDRERSKFRSEIGRAHV